MLDFIYNIVRIYVSSGFWDYIFPIVLAMMIIILCVHIIRRIINV